MREHFIHFVYLLFAFTFSCGHHAQNITLDCKVVVVGTGYGGSYFTWRTSVDNIHFNSSDICVFEAGSRVGGRTFTLQGREELPPGMVIDLGANRFDAELQPIIANLISKQLQLHTACYDPSDYECGSFGYGMHIISTSKGGSINAGFVKGIETMLGKWQTKGGGLVQLGQLLVKIERDGNKIVLLFEQQKAEGKGVTTRVNAEYAFLNIPTTSLLQLNKDSVIFTEGSRLSLSVYNDIEYSDAAKYFVYYEDAWWYTILDLREGDFTNSSASIPINGLYHEGPVYCDSKGICSGALLTYSGTGSDIFFFDNISKNLSNPLTVLSSNSTVLLKTHEELMRLHADKFKAKGVSPSSIAPPKVGFIGLWQSTLPVRPALYPGFGKYPTWNFNPTIWDEQIIATKPVKDLNLYVSDSVFATFESGWAEASLIMAEKIAHFLLGIPAPKWIPKWYYEFMIEGKIPEFKQHKIFKKKKDIYKYK